jgi:hypothetical protein
MLNKQFLKVDIDSEDLEEVVKRAKISAVVRISHNCPQIPRILKHKLGLTLSPASQEIHHHLQPLCGHCFLRADRMSDVFCSIPGGTIVLNTVVFG